MICLTNNGRDDPAPAQNITLVGAGLFRPLCMIIRHIVGDALARPVSFGCGAIGRHGRSERRPYKHKMEQEI